MSASSANSGKKASTNHFNRQLGLYSIAAAAAGVTALALVQPAAAEVVVTKKTIPIPDSFSHAPLPISMANNGVTNFNFFLDASSILGGSLVVTGEVAGDEVLDGSQGFYNKALALPHGAKIGPSPDFGSNALIEGSESSHGNRSLRGYWGGNQKNRYLGVSFLIDGQTHYGWVRLTVTTYTKVNQPAISATITAYAYETVANEPIYAGSTRQAATEAEVPENMQRQSGPSLGMLAAGADALPQWRREEASNSK